MNKRIVLFVIPFLICSGIFCFAQNFEIGKEIRYKNFSVWPVYLAAEYDLGNIITLDEGIEAGTVSVEELDGGENEFLNIDEELVSRSDFELENVQQLEEITQEEELPVQQAEMQQYQSGGGPAVNTLTVVNNSGKYLFIAAGEIIKGGKQNRTVSRDILIPSSEEGVPLDVFCVEQGRWTEDPEQGSKFSSGKNLIAQNELRKAIIVKSNQSEVWETVAEINAQQGVATDTDNYLANIEEGESTAAVQEYITAIQDKLKGREPHGIVAVINGSIEGLDLFFDLSLFAKHFEKILTSYAYDAVMSQGDIPDRSQVDEKRVSGFIASSLRGNEKLELDTDIYRFFRIDADRFAGSRLQFQSPEGWVDIHVTVLSTE